MNENHCSAPPLVDNAELLSSEENWSLGTTVLYSCGEGFSLIGQSRIVCGEDNGVVDWSGELPECRKLGTAAMIFTFLSFHFFTNIFNSCNFIIFIFNYRLVNILSNRKPQGIS